MHDDMIAPPTIGLMGILQKRRPTQSGQLQALEDARSDLGLEEGDLLSPVCVAYALVKLSARAEEVSRLLSWREFEGLAGAILRSSGLEVRENVVLTKPRAQIDLVASSPSLALSIDCKHYRREQGPSLLSRFARSQLRRSSLLRIKTKDRRPIASVILSMSAPEGRFVEGVAVVPIRTLRSFLGTIDSYQDLLDLR